MSHTPFHPRQAGVGGSSSVPPSAFYSPKPPRPPHSPSSSLSYSNSILSFAPSRAIWLRILPVPVFPCSVTGSFAISFQRQARARGSRLGGDEGGRPRLRPTSDEHRPCVHYLDDSFEVGTSRIEVRGFLAFGGPPRRHGCTQREKLVRSDHGRGLGTRFERGNQTCSPS